VPFSPAPSFLSSYCIETNRMVGENQSKTFERMKSRPDDAENCPLNIALAKLSFDGASLVETILRLTLCRELDEHVYMYRILLELRFPNTSDRVQHV